MLAEIAAYQFSTCLCKKIKNVCIALGLQELNGSGSQKLKKERLTALIRNMPHFEICT